MKIFIVHMTGGHTGKVQAETYTRDNDQYVFHTANGEDVEFFKVDAVDGITIEPEARSVSLLPAYEPPPDEGMRRFFQ